MGHTLWDDEDVVAFDERPERGAASPSEFDVERARRLAIARRQTSPSVAAPQDGLESVVVLGALMLLGGVLIGGFLHYWTGAIHALR